MDRAARARCVLKAVALLFSLASGPAELLKQCFVPGCFQSVECLVGTSHDVWGLTASTTHSLRLVDAAFARGKVELAAYLTNILTTADRAGMINSSHMQSAGT